MTKESKWKEIRRAYFPFPLSLPGLFLSPSLMLKRLLQWATAIWGHRYEYFIEACLSYSHLLTLCSLKSEVSLQLHGVQFEPCASSFLLIFCINGPVSLAYLCISSLKGADCTLALGLLVLNVLEWGKELYQSVFLSVPSLCIAVLLNRGEQMKRWGKDACRG